MAEGAGGGSEWVPGEIGGPAHEKVLWQWVCGWAGVVGFPCGEAVDRLAAYPASIVAVVGEVRVDAGYRPGKDSHVAY